MGILEKCSNVVLCHTAFTASTTMDWQRQDCSCKRRWHVPHVTLPGVLSAYACAVLL
jgi:hypothetical protein